MRTLIFLVAIVTCSSFTTAKGQIIKTSMRLTVLDELGNVVEGAKVRLFANENDYKKEENAVAEGVTDAKGLVKFKDLRAVSYYLLVEKDDLNNFGGGEQTGKLQEGRINKVNVVIN